MSNGVLTNIQERGSQNRLNLKLNAQLQDQLVQQRSHARQRLLAQNAQLQDQLVQQRTLARQRLLSQNAAVQAATKNAQVQSKLAVINANSQADAVRAQQRLQLLQTRAQVRAARTGQTSSARSTATGLRLAAKIAARPTWVDRLNERVDRLPTPGGLFALFMILLVFVFLIVPVSATGQTRFELFWLTLLGRTKLDISARGNDSEPKPPAPPGKPPEPKPPAPSGKPPEPKPSDQRDQLTAVLINQMSTLPIPPFGLPGMTPHGR